jgi:hypothetical protein
MMPLESKLSGLETDYMTLSSELQSQQFMLSGNWDYDKASFDRPLDGEKRTVWLRIPFAVPKGHFDPEIEKEATRVSVGTPYVLRHLYNNGDDEHAEAQTVGGFVNQFQSPVDPDASIEPRYIEEAKGILQSLEASLA